MLNKYFLGYFVSMASMTQKHIHSVNKFCFSAFYMPGSILILIIPQQARQSVFFYRPNDGEVRKEKEG